MADDREVPAELAAWAETLVYEFGLDPEQVPIGRILGLASLAAHGVTRPAAPLSAFVAGLVAGQHGASPEEITTAIDEIRALIADRDPEA